MGVVLKVFLRVLFYRGVPFPFFKIPQNDHDVICPFNVALQIRNNLENSYMTRVFYKALVLVSLMILFFVPMMGQTTAPTSITGTATICSGSSTTLTASGGTLDVNAVNVWYRGGYGGDAYDNGWDATSAITESFQSTINNNNNGILNLTSTGTDPQFYMRSLGSFDPSIYKYINVRYRVTAGNASNIQVFFLKTTIPNAAGDAYVPSGALNSDGNWHTISIDMSSSANWTSGGILLVGVLIGVWHQVLLWI